MPLVKGFETPATQWDQDSTWLLNITSTSYIPGDPEVGVTFMAPPSGRVMVIVGGGARDNGASNRVFFRPQIYRGTQAFTENLVEDGVDAEFSTPPEVDESIYGSRATIVSGLSPLKQHYARFVYSVTGGSTADIFVREIIVVPLP